MANALKAITARAKQIYKTGGTWKTAIKKAGAEYRGKKSGAKKKKPARRRKVAGTLSAGGSGGIMRRPRRKISGTLSAGASQGIMGLSAQHYIGKAKEKMNHSIGLLYTRIFNAKTKVVKRKLNKKLSELKSKYRKLC
jgi:hypothetical protein